MTFNPNIPGASDLLSQSQSEIQTNFSSSNTSFGVDHYAFDSVSNNGLHQFVTTPNAAVPTTVNDPKLYGFQPTANIGTIQFSKGPSDAVASPVTMLYSSSSGISLVPLATSNVLDCTGLTFLHALLHVTASDITGSSGRHYTSTVMNNGSDFGFSLGTAQVITPTSSGSILQIFNTNESTTFNNIFWTLQFLRIV